MIFKHIYNILCCAELKPVGLLYPFRLLRLHIKILQKYKASRERQFNENCDSIYGNGVIFKIDKYL